MELKEVVNLRKLREYYESSSNDGLCAVCPFRDVCASNRTHVSCILVKMLGINEHEQDLYEMLSDSEMSESDF